VSGHNRGQGGTQRPLLACRPPRYPLAPASVCVPEWPRFRAYGMSEGWGWGKVGPNVYFLRRREEGEVGGALALEHYGAGGLRQQGGRGRGMAWDRFEPLWPLYGVKNSCASAGIESRTRFLRGLPRLEPASQRPSAGGSRALNQLQTPDTVAQPGNPLLPTSPPPTPSLATPDYHRVPSSRRSPWVHGPSPVPMDHCPPPPGPLPHRAGIATDRLRKLTFVLLKSVLWSWRAMAYGPYSVKALKRQYIER
jgi:hypothetical protein